MDPRRRRRRHPALSLAPFMLGLFVARHARVTAFASPFRAASASLPLSARSTSTLLAADKQGQDDPGEFRKANGWKSDKPSSSGSSQTSEEKEPRTGWLHRSKPRVEEEKQKPKDSGALSAAMAMLQADKLKKQQNHRIVAPPTFYPSGEAGRNIVITEHKISVPLRRKGEEDIGKVVQDGEQTIDVYFTIVDLLKNEADEIFFRRIARAAYSPQDRAKEYVGHFKLQNMESAILYLQGGPGFGAPSPISGIGLGSKSSWAGAALSNGFERIVLMDQRGTGRSTAITKQTLQKRLPRLFENDGALDSSVVNEKSTEEALSLLSDNGVDVTSFRSAIGEAVEYMSNFRADNIVYDAEELKNALMTPVSKEKPLPWGGVLGQSFGGFCVMSYLSLVVSPPKICLLTGGIAPMLTPVQEAYDSLWNRVKTRSLLYYKRYPGDIKVVKKIVNKLMEAPVLLPSGGKLTARRFLQIGLGLGSSPSSFASLHNLFNTAFIDEDEDSPFSLAFLKEMEIRQSFDDNPIYFLMHESIYADGKTNSPTNWAAHTVLESKTKTPSEFDYRLTAKLDSDDRPVLLYGEMVFPFMADGDYAEVSGLGMKALAHGLARKDDWTPLYDAARMRKALQSDLRKGAAAVYTDDMYVDYDACRRVTAPGGPLEDVSLYITNEYQHSGLRDDGAAIFSKLLHMAKGSVNCPS